LGCLIWAPLMEPSPRRFAPGSGRKSLASSSAGSPALSAARGSPASAVGSAVVGSPGLLPSSSPLMYVSEAETFRPTDVDKIMAVMNSAMVRVSEVDTRCEEERRRRLDIERRLSSTEAELRTQAEAGAAEREAAAGRETEMLTRIARLEQGQAEARDALEALCDTVEWSATTESVRTLLAATEQQLAAQIEGVDTKLRAELGERLGTHEDLLHQLGEEVDHFAPTAESLAYAPPLANSPARPRRGPG